MQEEPDGRVPDVVSHPSAPRAAVIGHPVAHSLSPALHRQAYRTLGLDIRYDAVDVLPGEGPDFVAGLDPTIWIGLSVTMPHKVMLVDQGEPDDLVRLLGVANTLVLHPAPIVRNTDVEGVVRALALHDVEQVRTAVVLGNGATARSALAALATLRCTRAFVRGRDRDRAASLVPLGRALGVEVVPGLLTDAAPASVDLVLSSLPGGVEPALVGGYARAGAAVFDVAYDPWPSPLAAEAVRLGRPAVSGLDLLAGQAVGQVKLFTGQDIGIELLLDAGRRELARRAAGVAEAELTV